MNSKESLSLIEELIEKKLVQPEEWNQIKKYLAAKEKTESGEHSSKFITILSIIGAIFVGIGVIYFVASNRDLMADWLKSLLLILVMIAFYLSGLLMIQREYPRLGAALLIISWLIYWANIFLIGQIYNLGGAFYQAMGIRSLGLIIMAYTNNSAILALWGVLTFLIYLMSYFMENGLGSMVSISLFFSIVGICFIHLSRLHKDPKFKRFERVYDVAGSLLILWSFLPLTFRESFTTYDFYYPLLVSSPLQIWIAVTVLVSLILWLISYKKALILAIKQYLLTSYYAVALLLFSTFIRRFQPVFWHRAFVLLMNIFYVFLIMTAVRLGLKNQKERVINIALLFIVVFIIAKFIDLYSYLLIDRSLIFIGGGLILLAVGFFLERQRKSLLAAMKK